MSELCESLDNEGKLVIMAKDKKKKEEKKEKKQSEESSIPGSTLRLAKWVIGGYCTVTLGCMGWLATQVYELNGKVLTEDSAVIKSMQTDIDDLQTDIADLRTDVEEINEKFGGENGVYARLSVLENTLGISAISLKADVQSFNVEATVEPNVVGTSMSGIIEGSQVGVDKDGNVYLAEDLINKTVFLNYTEENQEVYFLGQYNEEYHWDGYCVTNVYNANGTLYGICESNFSNGKRNDYKSFYTSDGHWIYSDRECSEGTGVTVVYDMINNGAKNFVTGEVNVTDVVYIDSAIEDFAGNELEYYSGKTSGGVFEDITGAAYFVRYNDSGFVELLYKGKFENGAFNDDSAQELVLDSSNSINKYFYYEGAFSDNVRQGSVSGDDYVTPEQRDQIVEEMELDCELKWYEE